MAFLPVLYENRRSFGAEQEVSAGEQAYSYLQTGVSVVGGIAEGAVSIGASSAVTTITGISAATLGVVAAAAGYVGLVLAVVYIGYSLIMGNQKKVQAMRKMRASKREMGKEIGVSLINEVYGMLIPGWSLASGQELKGPYSVGEYYILGANFYNWSKFNEGTEDYERGKKAIVDFLVERGLDPTRFVGAANVKEGEGLKLMEMFVALPERILVSKEALVYLGYEASIIDSLGNDFHIRMFDMIKAMGRVKTEKQAVLVKKDIEDWLTMRSLDPRIFFNKPTQEAGIASIPSPTNLSKTISPEPSLLPGELEERRAIEDESSKMSGMLIAGIAIFAVLIMSRRRGGTA